MPRPALPRRARAAGPWTLLLTLLVLPGAAAQTPSPCRPGTASDTLDANNVRAGLYNNGALFWNGTTSVYEVPKERLGRAIPPRSMFTASIVVGGYVGTVESVSAATYSNYEFIPGPLDAQGRPPADCLAYDRIARLDASDLEALQRGTLTDAVRDWPWTWGAPVVDGDGVAGNYNLAGGDRPEQLGTQTRWLVMNAMGYHPSTSDSYGYFYSPPFPLEVQVTAFAAAHGAPSIDNATLYRYRLVWRGTTPMTEVYAGLFLDPDVGYALDDYMGSDTTLRVAYAYNSDAHDEPTVYGPGYGDAPPAVGVVVLEGPPVYDDDHDGQAETPGLTVMARDVPCPPNADCGRDPLYDFMRGLGRGREPMRACGIGFRTSYDGTYTPCPPTRWLYHGDPVTGQGWTESNLYPAGAPSGAPIDALRAYFGDARFFATTGPFTLQPGETRDVVLAILWARGTDHLDSITKLRREAGAMQYVWRAGLFAPTPPAPSLRRDHALRVGTVQPNPVRGTAHLRVTLPVGAAVRVWVVDALGRVVDRLHEGVMQAGATDVPVPTARLAPGAYVVRVALGGAVVSRPLVVPR